MTKAREEKTIRGLQFRVSKNIVAQLNKCTCTRSVRCNIFILYILAFLPYVKFRAVAVYTYIWALAFSYVITLSMAFLVDRWWDMLANRYFSLRYEKSRNRTSGEQRVKANIGHFFVQLRLADGVCHCHQVTKLCGFN